MLQGVKPYFNISAIQIKITVSLQHTFMPKVFQFCFVLLFCDPHACCVAGGSINVHKQHDVVVQNWQFMWNNV
jgi:hypothetical protein